MKIKTTCKYCGKDVWKWPFQIKNQQYSFCGSQCCILFYKPSFKGRKKNVICATCGKNIVVFMKEKNRRFCSPKCYHQDLTTRRGDKTSGWKGGKTESDKRKSLEYKEWRLAVFERDNYACVKCGMRGVELNAHHISSFKKDIKGQLDIDNGITLCKKCHKNFHDTYGRKRFTPKDILIFLFSSK
jgi:endogenous inhibitor of DNA gyrase (YacG/DUF329 family)